MKLFIFFILFTDYRYVLSDENHPLNKKLATWHTLKPEDIQFSRKRRSVDNILSLEKEISFKAFDKTFTMSLLPSPDIFSSSFKAYVSDSKGRYEVPFEKDQVLKGKLVDDSNSKVTAHLNDRVLTANIETGGETYVVEPMWRHAPKPQSSSSSGANHYAEQTYDMIVYRNSDLNLQHLNNPHSKDGFCDTKNLMSKFQEKHGEATRKSHNHSHHRGKREATKKKICKISLVADHRFYKEMGNSSKLETMYYLINLIERVNKIYKATNWDVNGDEDYTGYGFQINEILVFNESTNEPRFNQRGNWEARALLEAFSERKYSDCLSHLFTYVDFGRGLLGLAYVASEGIAGICCSDINSINKAGKSYFNTGLTSTVNWGQRILTTEADLVTAHELGHNFGAEHDEPGTINNICTPGQADGGNYIMYPAAVSGLYPNNQKFSECSKHNVQPILEKKAPNCFEEDEQSFCGNYQVEPHGNEECDVGITDLKDEDRCCYSNCSLKVGAVCSNRNYPCCTENCQPRLISRPKIECNFVQVASSSKMCRAHIEGLCLQDVYCDGTSYVCPEPLPVKDGTPCGDLGRCQNGHCESFCKTKGLKSCLCMVHEKEFCLRCCAPANATGQDMTKLCVPYTENGTTPQKLPDNSRCSVGYCGNGVCNKQTQDVIERVWDIFKHIAPDKIGQFLADNIVGAVLVFSLLFWIPCSCLVNFVDKKRLKERRRKEKWFTERGGEFSRASMFRSVPGGSAPNTPRIRRNIPVLRSGFGAQEQWRASQERGMQIRKSRENSLDRLDEESTPPEYNHASSRSDCNPVFSSVSSHRNSQPARPRGLTQESFPNVSPTMRSSLSENSFEGEVKPIAESSMTDIPAALASEENITLSFPAQNAAFRRHGMIRQGAISSPDEMKATDL